MSASALPMLFILTASILQPPHRRLQSGMRSPKSCPLPMYVTSTDNYSGIWGLHPGIRVIRAHPACRVSCWMSRGKYVPCSCREQERRYKRKTKVRFDLLTSLPRQLAVPEIMRGLRAQRSGAATTEPATAQQFSFRRLFSSGQNVVVPVSGMPECYSHVPITAPVTHTRVAFSTHQCACASHHLLEPM